MAAPPSPLWHNRIVRHAEVPPETLVAHPDNWRIHGDYQRRAMQGILTQVGWVDEIILNETTGHLLDGHMRLELALAQHEPQVPVKYVELTPEEERLVLLTFNPLGELTESNRAVLAGLLDETQTTHAGLQQFLDDLAQRHTLDGGPPTLTDLEQHHAEPTPEQFWPVLEVRLPPDVYQRYLMLMETVEGTDEVTRFTALLTLAEGGV